MSKPSAIPWSASGKFRNVADDHITRLTDITDMNMYQWQMDPECYLKILYIYLAMSLSFILL